MKFRALHNPNFNLESAQLGKPIRFEDGLYETDDLAEIKALKRHAAVEEVAEPPGPSRKSPPFAPLAPQDEDVVKDELEELREQHEEVVRVGLKDESDN
jgi:hypothetical protein